MILVKIILTLGCFHQTALLTDRHWTQFGSKKCHRLCNALKKDSCSYKMHLLQQANSKGIENKKIFGVRNKRIFQTKMSCPNIETFMTNDGQSYCRKAAPKNMMIVYMEKEKCILRQMHIKSLTFKKKSIIRNNIKSVSYISLLKRFLLVPHEGKAYLLSLVDNSKSFLRHTSVNEVLATAYDEGRDIIILARPWTCTHCSMLSFLTRNGTQLYEVDGCITKDIAVDTKRSHVFLLCANGNIRRLKDNNEGSAIVRKRLAKNHLCMDSRNDLLYYMTMKQGITGIWRINLSTYTDMNLATFKFECPGFHISGSFILIAKQRGRQLKVLKVSSKRNLKTIEKLTVKSSKQFPRIQFIPIA